jgi:hypothetical protein
VWLAGRNVTHFLLDEGFHPEHMLGIGELRGIEANFSNHPGSDVVVGGRLGDIAPPVSEITPEMPSTGANTRERIKAIGKTEEFG